MKKPSSDHSVEFEPFIQKPGGYDHDPTEQDAARKLGIESLRQSPEDAQIDHTVWDEPGLSNQLTGQRPDHALVYSTWLQQKIDQTGYAQTWLITFAVALSAGPWAVLGAFMNGGEGMLGIAVLTTFGPTVEEFLKISIALWVVEKRPFYFISRFQIAVCALAGGLIFAAIENLIYLNIYVPNPPDALVFWRWTVCVALHMGCTLICSFGLMQMWQQCISNRERPDISVISPYMILGIIIHGVYNGATVVMDWAGFHF